MSFQSLRTWWQNRSREAKAALSIIAGGLWLKVEGKVGDWFWKVVEWVADKAFGDAAFTWLKSGLGALMSPAWQDALWSWGPSATLVGIGLYLLLRPSVRATLVAPSAPAPFRRRAAAYLAAKFSTRSGASLGATGFALLYGVFGAMLFGFQTEHPASPAPSPASTLSAGVPSNVQSEAIPDRPPGRTRIQRAFLSDFADNLRTYRDYNIEEVGGSRIAQINVQRVLNFESNADFFAIYIPGSQLTFSMVSHIATEWNRFLRNFRDFTVTRQAEGDVNRFGGENLRFSGLIYLYTETILSIEEMADIRQLFKSKSISVLFRNPGTLGAETSTGRPPTPSPAATPSSQSLPSPATGTRR